MLASPWPLPHPRPPREVISTKEKNKYKFPPAALPSEFSTFFRGQAPPPPHSVHLAPPSDPSPFLWFPRAQAVRTHLLRLHVGLGEGM